MEVDPIIQPTIQPTAQSTSQPTTSQPTTTIDDLPIEMICEIFQHLPLSCLLNCKRVNRRWYSIVDAFKVRRLTVYDDEEFEGPADPCHPDLFAHLAHSVLLSGLMYLRLEHQPDVYLGKLNSFRQLKELVIGFDLSDIRQLNLDLPNLRRLKVHYTNGHCRISLDCANLQELYYLEHEDVDLLDIRHPETVRTLQSTFHGAKLARFKAIEFYEVFCYDNSYRLFEESTALDLASLRTVAFNGNLRRLLQENHFTRPGDEWTLLRSILSTFDKRRQESRRSDLVVYFAGVRLTSETIAYLAVDEDELADEFLMKNYAHLQKELPFVTEISYSRLMSLTDELPADYFERFCGIERICVRGPVKDAEHFTWFLKKLNEKNPIFEELDLQDPGLPQSFYDQLSSFASLTGFWLSEKNDLDYSFLRKFERLMWWDFSQEMSAAQAASLLRVFEHLHNLDQNMVFVVVKQQIFGVFKRGRSRYDLTAGYQPTLNNVELDAVIAYIEQTEKPSTKRKRSDSD